MIESAKELYVEYRLVRFIGESKRKVKKQANTKFFFEEMDVNVQVDVQDLEELLFDVKAKETTDSTKQKPEEEKNSPTVMVGS